MKIIILFILFFVSCSQSNDTETNKLIIGVPTEAVTLDPYASNDFGSSRVTVNIFNRLLEKDEEGNIIPSLATSWEFLSPTKLQLNLRSNVVFHNGEQFTAKDVKFSIERMLRSPAIESISNPMKGAEIIDSYTVNIILKKPFAPILSHLALAGMGILNEKAVKEMGDNIDQTPVGTGPYRLKEWNRGQNITLEAFIDYWAGKVNISEIDMRVISDESARTIALETGDIDIAYDIGDVDRERIINNSELRLIEQPIARTEYLAFNLRSGNPIWKDVRVREAVANVIDKEGIINSVLFGAGSIADSIIYKTVIGHYDGLTSRKRNVKKAQQLLQEAGVAKGTKVTMWTLEGYRQKILEVIQANLKEIGIDATIEVVEYARFLDGTAKGEHDLVIIAWTTGSGDADYGIYNLMHTTAFGGPGNRSFYSNAEVDQLLDKARVELDSNKRNKFYQRIQEILDKELPVIPLFYKLSNVGVSKKIKSFQFDPAMSHQLYYIQI